VDEDPMLCMQRDMELIEWYDKLGYAEAWIGEHHSGGYEVISSPDLFIAQAAERTKHIRLGTGVVSLPYHHPLILADRILQLDYQTRGRAMFGIGPGSLNSDAIMMGIKTDTQRARMQESIEIILRLFAGEVITYESDWFTLHEARVQLRPFTYPRPHIAVASAVTPFGAVLAGKHGLGMLCVAASSPAGYDVLDTNWAAANKEAAKHGRTMDRADLRLVAPMYLAETREKAIEDVRWGWEKHNRYTRVLAPSGGGLIPTSVEEIIEKKSGVIGTPDDAVEFLERYWEKTGGFGAILHLAINWPRFEDVKRSAELFSRYVMPKFTRRNLWREASFGWITEHTHDFAGQRKAAANQAIEAYFGKKTG
jgi:limonene 1,2-monooxygenase